MPFYTPLRYPGGKRRLFSVVTRLLEENGLTSIQYAEPYAGGAAVGLSLLFEEHASVIHLNDLSRPIFAFWHSAINATDDLCERIEASPIDMNEWHRQRSIYENRDSADLADLGFATLFLNRTNRSGIIAGGVIGGKQQAGPWALDVRFNKVEIVKRLKKIGRYRSRIRIYQMDALDFVEQNVAQLGSTGFAFIDPPYIENGQGLYLNEYTKDGHIAFSKAVERLTLPWACTYDQAATELGLYPNHRRIEYRLPYTAQGRHRGAEVMFFSGSLSLPREWSESRELARMTPKKSKYELFGKYVAP